MSGIEIGGIFFEFGRYEISLGDRAQGLISNAELLPLLEYFSRGDFFSLTRLQLVSNSCIPNSDRKSFVLVAF